MIRKLCALLCALVIGMTAVGCTDVADIEGDPTPATTTTTTTAPSVASTASQTDTTTVPTTATTAATAAQTTAAQTTAAPVDVPDEIRSANVSYYVKESAPVDPSFFDDAVFVGDSVSLKLTYYSIANPVLGNATFLTSGSLGIANSMWDLNRSDAVHPSYQGQTVTVPDGIARSGASKCYFMLGINDIGLYGVETTMANFKTLTDDILKRSPNITMYIQSVTPLYEDMGSLNNNAINQFNALLSEYCRTKGWYFVDVASVLRDTNGCLRREYCSDPEGMGIHFTDTACGIWADYLRTHTR